jgi:lysozyme
MQCGNCGTPNPETNKFCGNCGGALNSGLDASLQATIDKRIDAALASKLTDQRIVEIDVEEKVIARLTALAKIVGIPIALLLAVAGLWGVKSLSDLDAKVNQATDSAVVKMNIKVNAATDSAVQQAQKRAKESLETAVSSAEQQIQTEAQGSEKRFNDLTVQVEKQAADLTAAVKAQDAKLGKLQDTVNQLTAQQIGTRFEGVRLKAYRDPTGLWTIGSSHLLSPQEVASGKVMIDGKPVDFSAGITQQQSDQLLQHDLDAVGTEIDHLVTVKLTHNQKGALEDFVFNVGLSPFGRSNMLKELNAGNYDAVPAEMMKWTGPGGVVIPALKLRRQADVALWKTP